MKIGGVELSQDLRRIEAVLKLLKKTDQLAVDANGRFDLETALAYASALAPYRLRWYEEAGDPLDYDLQAKLSEVYRPPMPTGENFFSLQDTRNFIRFTVLPPHHNALH